MIETARLEIAGPRATLTLTRPAKRNALLMREIPALIGLIDQAEATRGVRVMVLTGEGGTFCSGVAFDDLAGVDWTDNPLIPALGNTTAVVEPLFGADWGKNLYFALEAQYKPTPASQFTALLGAYKAGIRCSGGQCRTLPGFNGVELTYTTQF